MGRQRHTTPIRSFEGEAHELHDPNLSDGDEETQHHKKAKALVMPSEEENVDARGELVLDGGSQKSKSFKKKITGFWTSTSASRKGKRREKQLKMPIRWTGVCQGVAYKNLRGDRYYPAAPMYILPRQPNCEVTFNFGPLFDCFSDDFGCRPVPKPMIEVPYHGIESQAEFGISDEKQV